MKKFLFTLLVAALASPIIAQVQQNQCATDEVYQQMIKDDPSILERQKLFDQQAEAISKEIDRKTGSIRVIPVVFHIFHKAGNENISDLQIQNEIDLLNQNFRRTGPKATQTRSIFQGVAGDMEIEFRLARKDPQGNCTNGIVRIYDEETENGTNNIKIKSVWPTDRYLNVWVVENIVNYSSNLPGIAGYAQFPWSGSYNTDGVIILSSQIGEIGTSRPSDATTVTHEIGHWMGCFHTFQDSCAGGDKVDDTPPAADIRNGILSCDYSRNSCGNDNPDLPDQIENFMDYTTGTCQNMFTIGQKARMDASLKNWRPYLAAIENLIATGTDVPNTPSNCAPIADFFAIDNQRSLSNYACANGLGVDFRDNSFNYTSSNPITRQWIFEGGTPSTSSATNPTVAYSAPGKYKVTLIVSNSNGADTIVKENYIEVLPEVAPRTAPYTQDFEFPVFPVDGWFTNSTTFTDYRISDVGQGTVIPGNSRTLMAPNGTSIAGARFDLYSPSFDLSNMPDAKLSYFYAFAQRNVNGNPSNDQLRIYYSTNCGQSWSPMSTTVGNNLGTVGGATGPAFTFVPTDATKWRQVVHNIPGSITAAQRKNLRFRFQFVSNGGNNFYIDAINIGFTAGIEKTFYEGDANFNVYPNPTSGATKVALNILRDSDIKVSVKDIMGREIAVLADGKYNQGEQEFDFDAKNHNVANGLYFVTLSVNGNVFTKKLMYNN